MSLFGLFQRQHTSKLKIGLAVKAPNRVSLSYETLTSMNWYAFEQLVELYFDIMGMRVNCLDANDRTGKIIQLFNVGTEQPYALVKCLARASHDMDIEVLRQFPAIRDALQIPRTIAIMNIPSSDDLKRLALQGQIKLLDINAFWNLVRVLPSAGLRTVQAFLSEQKVFEPHCPHCALELNEHVNASGKTFKGCSNYPKCPYTE